jgi:hypothetical protein
VEQVHQVEEVEAPVVEDAVVATTPVPEGKEIEVGELNTPEEDSNPSIPTQDDVADDTIEGEDDILEVRLDERPASPIEPSRVEVERIEDDAEPFDPLTSFLNLVEHTASSMAL